MFNFWRIWSNKRFKKSTFKILIYSRIISVAADFKINYFFEYFAWSGHRVSPYQFLFSPTATRISLTSLTCGGPENVRKTWSDRLLQIKIRFAWPFRIPIHYTQRTQECWRRKEYVKLIDFNFNIIQKLSLLALEFFRNVGILAVGTVVIVDGWCVRRPDDCYGNEREIDLKRFPRFQEASPKWRIFIFFYYLYRFSIKLLGLDF